MSTERRLRCCWVAPDYGLGGVGSVAAELAAAAEWIGDCESTLLVLHGELPTDGTRPARAATLALGACRPEETAERFSRWLEEHAQDVVFLNDVGGLWPLLPRLSPKLRSVFVLHDEGRRYVEPIRGHQASLDHVVAVSTQLGSYLRRAVTGLDRKLTVIPNALCPREPLATPEPRPHAPLRLLYVGAIDFLRKGVQDLPRIVSELARRGNVDHMLSIVGGTSDRLLRLFARRRVGGRVRWLGRVSRDECFRVAAEHDVMLVPSRVESFGMAVVEAMSVGCVPIAYDVDSGLQDVIRNGETGFLVPLCDYATVAGIIEGLAGDPARLRRMSDAARADVTRRFEARVAAAAYARLAASLMASPASRTGAVEGPRARRDVATPAILRRAARRFVESRPELVQWFWRRFA